MIHKYNTRGFTLIELLVVIAIIGILSAVVLASLNTARDKGSDAAIQADITGIRTQAQLFYTDHSNSYTGVCDDTTVAKQILGADTTNGTTLGVVCHASDTAYAVSAALVATPGTFFCVDSTGVSKTLDAQIGENVTSCE